jgi:hypothetical protein
LPSTLNGLSDASAAACVKTAALVGGPEAQRLLARWSPDPRGAVQRALAQVWRYFDPGDYAEAVLADAPLDNGKIKVELFEHVPQLRKLQNLHDASIDLTGAGKVEDLNFLRDAPPVVTQLEVEGSGPLDLTPLAECPTLKFADMQGSEASAGWEALPAIRALWALGIDPPNGGGDLSFFSALAECPSLTLLDMRGCTELSDLSALVSASGLRGLGIYDASRLYDLRALIGLANLQSLHIGDAPLTGGLVAVAPVLDRLNDLSLLWVPTATSFDELAGSSLQRINLAKCPATSLEPLTTVQSLEEVRLQRFPALDLSPLARLRHLQKLFLRNIDEPVDLSSLAQIDHRIQIGLHNTSTVGTAGPLVKIQRS